MRVLIVSNLFPPQVIGGAEVAAHCLAVWLAAGGHEVRVLTSAFSPEEIGCGDEGDGVVVERLEFPHIYPLDRMKHPLPLRGIWHWQDHFSRVAERQCAKTIENFAPDLINVHNLQGLGYSALRAVAASGVPCVQTLHDLGYLCLNMAMFRKERECPGRHLPCALSGAVKRRYWAGIERLSFWSPSRAVLERYRPHLPSHFEATAIRYPLTFATSEVARQRGSGPLRLLYVGQITAIKGVEFILGVLAELSRAYAFHFQLVGGGAELERLREKYRGAAWVEFIGHVPPEQVGDYMQVSDLMLAPSLWFETSSLVIYQAIKLGLPVVASRTGGLPEIVTVNGALAEPGDAVAWTAQLRAVLSDPAVLDGWRAGTASLLEKFSIDYLGAHVLALFERTRTTPSAKPALA